MTKYIQKLIYGRNALGSYLEMELTNGDRYKIESPSDNMSVVSLATMAEFASRERHND